MANPPTLTIHTLNIDPDEEDHYSSSSSPSDEEESFSESESGSGSSEEEDEDEDGGQDVEGSGGGEGGKGAGGKGKGKEKERSGSVDGDFDRLIQGIRSQTSTGTTLIKDWDMSFVAQQEAEFKDDLREASGVGRKRRKKGRTTGPTLSHQVKSLIGEANQAYIDSNLPLTIDLMTEVIRIEPRASAAWSVLAQCYDDLSDSHTALKLRVMAAHLRNDAEEWERLGRKSREMGLIQQALYCFGKMTQVDPENMEYLWDRAVFAKEVGEGRVARSCFLGILKRYPNDLVVLREVHPILVECGELGVCAQLLQQAFEFHLRGRSDEGGGENNPNRLTILDVLLLADLYNALGAYEKAVDVIRKGVRWLQGREDQRYWDLCEDDREYDLPGTIRDANGNTLVAPPSGEDVSATIPPPGSGSGSGSLGPGVGPGGIGGAGPGGGQGVAPGGGAPQTPLPLPGRPGAGMQPGYYPLDTNARHRLAVARIKMGDVDEGKRHASIILSEDVLDYAVLFSEIADAYFEREMWAEARPIYELLGGDPATSSIYVLLQTAACMRNLEQLKEAAEVYEHIRLADPTHNDAKMKLAEIYEILGETRRALDLVYEVIDSRKKRKAASQQQQQQQQSAPDPSSSAPNAQQQPGSGGGLFAEPKKPLTTSTSTSTTSSAHQRAQNRLTHAQLRELEAEKEREVKRGFGRLRELWGAMLGGGGGLGGGSGRYGEGGGGEGGELRDGEGGQKRGGEDERRNQVQVDQMTQEEAERLWMLEAEKLVDMFRETRNLFLTSRANPFRGMFPRSGRKKRERQRTEVEEDQMASRLQLDLERDTLARTQKSKQQASDKGVDNFRGVSFDEWLRMIFQYCFVLTKRDQFDLADEILRHILVSNAYQAQERQDAIRIALITCALHAHSHPTIVDQCRKLITRYQFNNEPLRLLLASLSSGLRPTDAFITSTLQKHLFREMKLADVAVRKPELLKWNALNKRYAYVSGAGKAGGGSKGDSADPDPDPDRDGDGDGDEDEDEDEVDVESVAASVSGGERKGGAGSGAGVGVGGAGSGLGGAGSVVGGAGGSGSTGTGSGSTTGGAVGGPPDLPTKQNPVLVAIYGQICIAAKSYQSGIFYLLHAYDYAPYDPMICLCLAIASVGRAMQRQSDNRHHLIAQGMAFLSQYRTLRSKSPRTVREVEYNFGRIFHQLGLYSYAVKQYERVLELAERDGDDLYAKEAAYNLSLIYVFTGATPLADKLYRRWLSL